MRTRTIDVRHILKAAEKGDFQSLSIIFGAGDLAINNNEAVAIELSYPNGFTHRIHYFETAADWLGFKQNIGWAYPT
jgi:hypothetical protein